MPEGESAILFLKDVEIFPDSGTAKRYHRLGVSVRQGQRMKERLVAEGLISEAREITQTGIIRVIRLTEKGKAILREHEKTTSGASESAKTGG